MSHLQARTTAAHAPTLLTVVLVAADRFETIRRTLTAVSTQTIAGQLEVLSRPMPRRWPNSAHGT